MDAEDFQQRLAVSEAQNAELWSRLRMAESNRDEAIARAEAAEAQRDELAAALDGLLGEARLCVKASAFRSPACLSEVIGAAEEALAKVRR